MPSIYHVFTDGKDYWSEDFNEARNQFKEWATEGKNVRLYEEILGPEDEIIDEDCIMAAGNYPH